MDDTLYALYFAVCCGTPAGGIVENGDLLLCEIGGGVDGEVVGDRREDDDGAEEEEGEDGEKGVEGTTSVHCGAGQTTKPILIFTIPTFPRVSTITLQGKGGCDVWLQMVHALRNRHIAPRSSRLDQVLHCNLPLPTAPVPPAACIWGCNLWV